MAGARRKGKRGRVAVELPGVQEAVKGRSVSSTSRPTYLRLECPTCGQTIRVNTLVVNENSYAVCDGNGKHKPVKLKKTKS